MISTLLLTVAALSGCSGSDNPGAEASKANPAAALTLVYSGNNDGEYEPCG